MKRKLEHTFAALAGLALVATIIGACCIPASAVESRRRCRHYPSGCCHHDLLVRVWWPYGPCGPDCLRRENQCGSDMPITPGGSVGIRVRSE